MKAHSIRPGTFSFSFIAYMLVFGILLSSCTTTSSHKIDSGILKGSDLKIDNAEYLVLKNGSFVSLQGRTVWLKRNYKDFLNVLVVTGNVKKTIDDAYTKDNEFQYRENVFPLDSVKELYVTKTETDATGTVMLVIGSILGAALFIVIIAAIELSNHPIHSCPFIYSFDGEKYVMDAEPLGGAVCEGLERTDVSKLENLKEIGGMFKVRVKNSNDEKQYIDKVEFTSINRGIYDFSVPDCNGKFFKYRNPLKPVSAVNEYGDDISRFISELDGVRWFNELPSDISGLNYSSNETLTIRFPKPSGIKNALLIINGGASYFGSAMIPEMLKLNWKKVNEIYKNIYPGSDMQKKLFYAMHRDESYYLDIKTRIGNELINQGIMRSNGPIAVENIAYPLYFNKADEDYVEIVLNPQRYFWKFDYINIAYEFEETSISDSKVLDFISARDNYGNDILYSLDDKDKDYYMMPLTGEYSDILLKVPDDYNPEKSDIYVSTTGWYEINLNKNIERDDNLINKIFFSPNGLFVYALELYKNKLSYLTQNLNTQNK